jgi:hypothetical protein
MATSANQQLADTLSGKYLNPFLSPMLQGSANEIATSVNQEFTGAGRTPGSGMNQQQILSGITQEALPYAFDQYERERQRQLGIASASPTLVQTGAQLEDIQRQQNMAPYRALQQYGSLVSPIAGGFPVTTAGTTVNPNRVTQGLGGALIGNMIGGADYGLGGAVIGGLLGGLL